MTNMFDEIHQDTPISRDGHKYKRCVCVWHACFRQSDDETTSQESKIVNNLKNFHEIQLMNKNICFHKTYVHVRTMLIEIEFSKNQLAVRKLTPIRIHSLLDVGQFNLAMCPPSSIRGMKFMND
jgi:hypothetical protein